MLATIPELHGVQEQTGDDNRGVRVYNLSDEALTCTVLDDAMQEIPGAGRTAAPFDLGQQTWDATPGFMTSPMTMVRIQAPSGSQDDYFVNGDSSQAIIVLPPVAEGLPPEPAPAARP